MLAIAFPLAFALSASLVGQPPRAQTRPHPTGTIVVSNMNDNTATVIDVATNHVLATLPTGEGRTKSLRRTTDAGRSSATTAFAESPATR